MGETQYKRQLVFIDMKRMAIWNVLLSVLVVGLILLAGYFARGRQFFTLQKIGLSGYWGTMIDLGCAIAALFLGLIVHELLHAVGFLTVGRAKPADVRFGGGINGGMLYCACAKPMTKWGYTISGLLPSFATLAGCVCVALFGDVAWALVAGLLMGGCIGDIMMFSRVMKYPRKTLFQDHPKVPGYYVLYPEDALPEGFTEADEEQERQAEEGVRRYQEASRKTNRMVWPVLLGVLILLVAGLILAAFLRN